MGVDFATGWPGTHALAALHECNERFLDLLQAQLRVPGRSDPFAREVGPLLLQLDVASKAQAARCAVLLADPGFADGRLWGRALSGVAAEQEYGAGAYFDSGVAVEATRVILTCAAHLAYSDAASARLLFGLSPGCIDAFAGSTVTRVAALADTHWAWLKPRWLSRPRYWRDLLVAELEGTPASRARMRVRGLQLLAGEARTG